MKIKLLLFLFVFLPNAKAQSWIDTGAIWHYEVHVVPFTGIRTFEYTQDTMIGGQLCQEITSQIKLWGTDQFGDTYIHSNTTQPAQYSYSNGDTVFYWNEGDSQFYTLYNFDANIGEQWLIGSSDPNSGTEYCMDSSYVEVIDTGSIVINSMTLRTITLRPTDSSSLALWGRYAERIGFLGDGNYDHGGLFPYVQGCDDNVIYEYPGMWLNCFEDESFPLYNPGLQSCEHFLGNESTIGTSYFSVFPNPSADYFNVISPHAGTLKIFDMHGKLVFLRENITNKQINISNLESGVYILQYISSKGNMQQLKLIRE